MNTEMPELQSRLLALRVADAEWVGDQRHRPARYDSGAISTRTPYSDSRLRFF